LIEKYFSPLTGNGAPAFSLKNDAAVFSPKSDTDLVFTKDALVADVHFFSNDDPELIAERALRCNLSDLAAMGAEPLGYLLSLALPNKDLYIEAWLLSFCKGLENNQKLFKWSLWGGDSVATNGPITISITAIGETKKASHLTRTGAKVGDGIYVSGTLGDAAAAIKIIENDLDVAGSDFILNRFYKPFPRLKLGKALVNIASSALDISDGLIGDLSHICKNSGVGAHINQPKIPISAAFGNLLETKPEYNHLSWTGGDDYELLFTVPPENEKSLLNIPNCQSHGITKIGEIIAEQRIVLLDERQAEIRIDNKGYRHFEN
jgi:thiamine-monophosphate kinase